MKHPCSHNDLTSGNHSFMVPFLTKARSCTLSPMCSEDGEDDSSEASSSSSTDVMDSNLLKEVRFDLNANMSYESDLSNKEDCRQFWHTSAEYATFKAATFAAARDIQAAEQHNMEALSYHRILERVYLLCLDANEENPDNLLYSSDQRHLERWMDVGIHRHGMEKWIVRSIGKDKALRRQEIVDMVLDLQDLPVDTKADKDEFIRISSERLSRTSRLFAVLVGHAQAGASSAESV